MGHRFSKSPAANTCETVTTSNSGAINSSSSSEQQAVVVTAAAASGSGSGNRSWSEFLHTSTPQPPPQTINLQIQEEGDDEDRDQSFSNSTSSNSVSSSSHRQIIIKIQLAKMVNDNGLGEQQPQHSRDSTTAQEENGNATWVNTYTETAGSFSNDFNRNNNRQEQPSIATPTTYPLLSQMDLMSLEQRLAEDKSASQGVTLRNRESYLNESTEYVEVLEYVESDEQQQQQPLETSNSSSNMSVCCRCQKSKRRCCKCTCRDAFRRILEPSSKSHKNKSLTSATAKHSKTSQTADKLRTQQRHSLQPSSSGYSSMPNRASVPAPNNSNNNNTASPTNSVAIWAAGNRAAGGASSSRNDVLIPLNPPFLVVQCPARTSVVTVGGLDDTIRVVATELVADNNATTTTTAAAATTTNTKTANTATPTTTTAAGVATGTGTTTINRMKNAFVQNGGPIVHSQVDFVHYLVPDLEKITNSSFYWGKMDRYEAERLLDGKAEGTFLLRDSAQEEFLFSVTFRKYGRSLHARIEQSGHKFSFDCHDPSVFTAFTVTGLLEHYKDPACVMFFEPMLTIPLHRAKPFSLQQLCRASIVSHTTYDGINEMELPTRLKSYLKEYHYKQKLRVKPFDEPFYTCT